MFALALAWLVAAGVPAAVAAPTPSYAFKFGGSGAGNGQFSAPYGVAVDRSSGDVYVADTSNDRVQKFSADGGYLSQFGTSGSGDGQLAAPLDVTVDSSSGNVYVLDSGNSRVEEFTAAGAFVRKWGTVGSGNAQFELPTGIGLDPSSGDVYVSDQLNNNVQKFSPTGTYLSQFGGSGTADGKFTQPSGVAVEASTRDVYVVDKGNARVQKFDASGTFVNKFGTPGSGDGQFNAPIGVAVDPSGGDVYVADSGNNRVEQFSLSGSFLGKFGSSGTGNGQFSGSSAPTGVAVSSSGSVYAVDGTAGGGNRVEVFAPPPVCQGATASVNHNRAISVGLSCTDPSLQPQTLQITAQPAHGTLGTVTQTSPTSATVSYTPDAGYSGPDSFTFDATGAGTSNSATVTLNVAPGTASTCQSAAQSTRSNTPATLALQCSGDGDPLVRSIVHGPAHGTLGSIDQTTGAVTYTPKAGYTGRDQISFRATRSFGTSNTATYSLIVVSPGKLVLFAFQVRKAPRKLAVRYVVTQAAPVTLTVHPPHRRAVIVARAHGHAGVNRIAWNRRLGGKRAKPGTYKLTVTATVQGHTTSSTISVVLP